MFVYEMTTTVNLNQVPIEEKYLFGAKNSLDTFGESAGFQVTKKWQFQRPNLRTDSKNLAKQPPKWFNRHLIHAFSISGRVSGQFLKIMFLEAFYPLKRPKNRNRWPSRENASKIFFCCCRNGFHIDRTKLY